MFCISYGDKKKRFINFIDYSLKDKYIYLRLYSGRANFEVKNLMAKPPTKLLSLRLRTLNLQHF